LQYKKIIVKKMQYKTIHVSIWKIINNNKIKILLLNIDYRWILCKAQNGCYYLFESFWDPIFFWIYIFQIDHKVCFLDWIIIILKQTHFCQYICSMLRRKKWNVNFQCSKLRNWESDDVTVIELHMILFMYVILQSL